MGKSVLSLPLLDILTYRAGHAVLFGLHHMDTMDRARLPPEETTQAAADG